MFTLEMMKAPANDNVMQNVITLWCFSFYLCTAVYFLPECLRLQCTGVVLTTGVLPFLMK